MAFSILTTLLALQGSLAQAGSFSVTPVRMYFQPKDRAVAVTLINEGDQEIQLQAEVHRWRQDQAGHDQLEPSDDLIVAPPSLRMLPRSRQVIRLALLVPRDPVQQMTYRLIVREIPETLPTQGTGMQLPIALALNMPIFITPQAARRQVQCTPTPDEVPLATLSCENTGTAYAQLRQIELRRGGDLIARFEGSAYVLPGARKKLPLTWGPTERPGSGQAELSLWFDDFKPTTQSVTLP